ncbi:hypothetical protein J4227_00750 [Candidatus Woesearchaeota archaeon]|nr:hypothetical protein [Candidatus Woesearchaeota archaeon]
MISKMYKEILYAVYIMLCVYLIFRLFSKLGKPKSSVRDEINEILNSDKYKVKGKFEG